MKNTKFIKHAKDENVTFTFLRCVEGIIFRHVLDVVLQRGIRQYNFVLVDLVNGVLEGQLRAAILLVMSEYSTWKVSTTMIALILKVEHHSVP